MDQPHPEYPLLFSPLQVGPITLRNRIVNSPHQTGFAKDFTYSEQLVEYHRERAHGGSALLVSQGQSVSGNYMDMRASDDAIIEGYRRVSEVVRENGAHYNAELYHPGAQGDYTASGAEVFHAPSSIPAGYLGHGWRVPHEMTEAEIFEAVDMFATAAERCRKGGLSGIELHFAHGNLVEQFMSPKMNWRTDDWGGSFENRLRFAELVASAVREAAGPELAVGARMTAAGLDPGDLNELDMAEVIGTVASWGHLDYVSLTMGHYSDEINEARNMPTMAFGTGVWERYGKQIKHIVDIPVFLVGRINHPRIAEDLLEAEACDAVVMARALIADPHLPEKARTGRTADIRPCVAAMNCIQQIEKSSSIRCIHNPRVGHELEMPELVEPGAGGKRVVVVGGGPGGLEAARVAAVRGHDVTLLERSAKVGGRLNIAARTPGREELAGITEWLEQQCRERGVDIRTSESATPEFWADANVDVVVMATGGHYPEGPVANRWIQSKIADELRANLAFVGLDEVLAGNVTAKTAVLYDDMGDWPGFNAARILAEAGVAVRYITREPYPGIALQISNWRMEYEALSELGVEFMPSTHIVGSVPGGLKVSRGYRRQADMIEDVELLVWIAPPSSDKEGPASLPADFAGEVITIGDAYAPRGVQQAILEARLALSEV